MEPSVEWATRVPAARLRGLVDRYVGYRMVGLDPTTHRGLPSRHMTFIVSIGPPIDVPVQTNPLQPAGSYRCVLSGLQASSAQVSHDGTQEGVLIEMTPLGCRALLWMPAAVLWDQSFELSDVIGPVGDELWERLQPAKRWSDRFDVCDDVLLGRLDEQHVPRALAHCWQGIVVSGGRISVDRLATRAGYSRQHLTRLFRAEFGLGPKLASRVVRFEAAQRMLRTSPSVPFADVASACGYADHAHMTREFTELAGCTPGELVWESVPILQDGARAAR